MAVEYRTKTSHVKVYNLRGTQVGEIQQMNTLVTVTDAAIDIGSRGSCFPISQPKVGYVPVGNLKAITIVDPPPPPPSGGKAFTLAVDGYKPYSGELEKA